MLRDRAHTTTSLSVMTSVITKYTISEIISTARRIEDVETICVS